MLPYQAIAMLAQKTTRFFISVETQFFYLRMIVSNKKYDSSFIPNIFWGLFPRWIGEIYRYFRLFLITSSQIWVCNRRLKLAAGNRCRIWSEAHLTWLLPIEQLTASHRGGEITPGLKGRFQMTQNLQPTFNLGLVPACNQVSRVELFFPLCPWFLFLFFF